MIAIRDINKSFGPVEVLRGITAEIADGEIVAIVGASGAGKTTLLQIVGTLDRPDSGRVLYGDIDPFSLSDRALCEFRNSHIGFVFQFHQLLPEFTCRENVALPALVGGKSRREAMARADELLTYLGLTGRADHRPAQMSGGEKQRAAVARALVNRPSVILADEPSGSLDSRNRDELRRLLWQLRADFGTTIAIVTHDEEFAADADRVLHIIDGKIVAKE